MKGKKNQDIVKSLQTELAETKAKLKEEQEERERLLKLMRVGEEDLLFKS